MSTNLYRVGVPSIGETWLSRYTKARSTGGLGTGVYGFRTMSAARKNIEQTHGGKEVFTLREALDSPLQPASEEATRAIDGMSRRLSWVRYEVETGSATYEDLIDRASSVRVSLSGSFGAEKGLGSGKSLGNVAFDILLHTTELREEYGLDKDRFVADALRATRTATERCEGRRDLTCVQPINALCWPQWDGIAPYPGAGGDSGTYGCVIFKQKIDHCVGHTTEKNEQMDAGTLNTCFHRNGAKDALVR